MQEIKKGTQVKKDPENQFETVAWLDRSTVENLGGEVGCSSLDPFELSGTYISRGGTLFDDRGNPPPHTSALFQINTIKETTMREFVRRKVFKATKDARVSRTLRKRRGFPRQAN